MEERFELLAHNIGHRTGMSGETKRDVAEAMGNRVTEEQATGKYGRISELQL